MERMYFVWNRFSLRLLKINMLDLISLSSGAPSQNKGSLFESKDSLSEKCPSFWLTYSSSTGYPNFLLGHSST